MEGSGLSISQEKMLVSIHEQLSVHFFGCGKTVSKSEFNMLKDGELIDLLKISSSTRGEINGKLALNASEFVGKLNYSKFRDALGAHLNHIAHCINNKQSLNVLTNQENGAFLYNLPGFVQRDGELNVLVTGVEQQKPGEIVISLIFLNPDGYRAAADQAAAAANQTPVNEAGNES